MTCKCMEIMFSSNGYLFLFFTEGYFFLPLFMIGVILHVCSLLFYCDDSYFFHLLCC